MSRRDHGGDIYRNKNAIDFSSNCNPYGPPEEVVEAIREAALKVGSYPDPLSSDLKKGIAGRFGLPEECVFTGNGAAEIIYAICSGLRPGKVLIPAPAFSEYEEAARQAGSTVDRYYTKPDHDFIIGEDF
ncbi:MAG: aminotransferase class I/II-fold pyridoxal phosphate-dependent enzyme, partial [Firmicutes bacterium]|nr:aminotransferase class I/II-fold pyridoxal phosphate-dependent enzyme [Bacillota bacterium]